MMRTLEGKERSSISMNGRRRVCVSVAALIAWSVPSLTFAFTSGSTEALGAFAPIANTTVTLPPDGILNYSTVNIPAGVTITFARNAANTPVTLLATGDVTIAGTLSVAGKDGGPSIATGPIQSLGGLGGPGAFTGGTGQSRRQEILASAGQGPGGGAPGTFFPEGATSGQGATYGVSTSFVELLPLVGGSGGGGGGAWLSGGTTPVTGGGGGGGGGAMVIASSTRITVSGTVTANGGAGGNASCGFPSGGGGSGGALRLVAPVLTVTGVLQAAGGAQNCATAGVGRIRFEAPPAGQTLTGTVSPPASVSSTFGPITASSDPALLSLPSLTISSVGGIVVPTVPAGSYSTADLALPTHTLSAVPVVLTASNTPLNTIYTVRLVPSRGNATTVNAAPPVGTPTLSTATATVTFPSGQVSVLNAYASLTLTPLTAALFPSVEGETVESLLMAAALGGPSSTTLVTKSGREVPVSALSREDLLRVALAVHSMTRSSTVEQEGDGKE